MIVIKSEKDELLEDLKEAFNADLEAVINKHLKKLSEILEPSDGSEAIRYFFVKNRCAM